MRQTKEKVVVIGGERCVKLEFPPEPKKLSESVKTEIRRHLLTEGVPEEILDRDHELKKAV